MDHQDFKPVILRGKPKPGIPSRTIVARGNKPDLHKMKIENEQDSFVIKKVPISLCKEIVAARVTKKLSQKDVATRLNIQLKDYNSIESGKAIYDQKAKETIQKVQRLFGVKFVNK